MVDVLIWSTSPAKASLQFPEHIIIVFFGARDLPGENPSKLVRINSEDRQGRQE